MFLERVPPRGISFRKPGAIHRARFLSRLIYALKIVLFKYAGFKLTKRETQGLVDFCVFDVVVFIKSRSQVESPSAKGALKKLSSQLSEELVALAYFDKDVDASEKRAMVEGG